MTHSVTGCSTCSRVFISRKKNRPSLRRRGTRRCRRRRSPTASAAATAAAHSRARIPSSTSGEGASSTTFWCRRWMEHSRSPSAQTVPWASAMTWTSMCRRPPGTARRTPSDRRTRCRPRSRAASISPAARRSLRTIRMPRPPPPADALISTGRSASVTRGRLQIGRIGTPGRRPSASSPRSSSPSPRSRPGAARSRSARRRAPRGRRRRSPRGTRSRDGRRRRRRPARPRRSARPAGRSRPGACPAADRLVGLPDVRRVGVGVGVHGDGGDAQSRQVRNTRRAISPRFATSRLECSSHVAHIRKTPKPAAPATGALWIADRHRPSTVRVSRGR